MGQYVVDDSNWEPHFVGDVGDQVQATFVKKFDFIEKQHLTDELFQVQNWCVGPLRTVMAVDSTCFLEKKKRLHPESAWQSRHPSALRVLHSLSMLAWMLFGV
ncbi:MAG: hypothetical protein R3B54_11400 [Bdellovibrionota bacterium]